MADNLTDPASTQALLTQGLERLAPRSDSARLDAELLLAHVLERPRVDLLAHAERRVPSAAATHFLALVQRRAAGEPLAYLTGEREFWSLPLRVTPQVLIPRPETELAVERCLALLAARRAAAAAHCDTGCADEVQVADLGTGSGAIALALAVERPAWRIVATDCSTAALRVARGNAERLGLHQVEFLEGDWFAPLRGRQLDLIVSNPPYIAAADPALAQLRYEPATALCPGASGMEALLSIIAQANAFLRRGGWLVLEHGVDQAADVARALVGRAYARVRCHRDLAGRERVTEAQWPLSPVGAVAATGTRAQEG